MPRKGRAWYPEKRNDNSRDRRYWDLGADIATDGVLTIYRKPCGETKDGNRVIRFHQNDTEKNPDAVDIVQDGTGLAMTFRTSEDQESGFGRITRLGAITAGSAKSLKENFKSLHPKSIQKMLKMPVDSWNFIDEDERSVGPTAEDFKEFTGYGDGSTINQMTFLGITFRCLQFVYAALTTLEKRVAAIEPESTTKKELENNENTPAA